MTRLGLLLTVGLLVELSTVLAAAAVSAPASASAAGYRIVLASDRDGEDRAYSVRPDGSRLAPLLPRRRALNPIAVSADGSTVAYDDGRLGLFVSRASGKGLHRVPVDLGAGVVLSPDGKLVAFTSGDPTRITVMRSDDGRLVRHLSTANVYQPDWSPDGDALVFTRGYIPTVSIVVETLDGERRVLARGEDVSMPRWSPDGRWIAYQDNGLWLVRPDGSQRRRLTAGNTSLAIAWSPDSRTLATFVDDSRHLAVVSAERGVLRRLNLDISWDGDASAPIWSPDGRQLALRGHAQDEPDEVWVFGRDGSALRRVTDSGTGVPLGTTRETPALGPVPPLKPAEHVLTARSIATSSPVEVLSADGPRVAFVTNAPTDCDHVEVWTPGRDTLTRVSPRLPAPCPEYQAGDKYGLQLAGTRVAWIDVLGCGNYCDIGVESATISSPVAQRLTFQPGAYESVDEPRTDDGLRGDEGLLVFGYDGRLMRVGGHVPCQKFSELPGASGCTALRSGPHTAPVASVSGGLIAILEPKAVAIVDGSGKLVRVLPFKPHEVAAARLDGKRLVVARSKTLEAYDVSSGERQVSRPLPHGYRLVDVDGGVAVLRRTGEIRLLRLDDGNSLVLTPGRGPIHADLERSGLFYSYAVRWGRGRLAFVSRAELTRRFPAGGRTWWPWALAGALVLVALAAVRVRARLAFLPGG